MPVLDAKALEIDPEGMALLRSVLQSGLRRKRPTAAAFDVDPCRTLFEASARSPKPCKRDVMVLAEPCH